MYVCLPPVVSLPCLLPRIPQAPRKPILPRCYTVNLSIDLCALLVVRRLARGHSKTQRRPLSATHSSYPTFQPFRAFTHFPSYQTNSFICFSTFLSPGTLANKALATLSTTPSTPRLSLHPVHLLTSLGTKRIRLNSFNVFSTFVSQGTLENTAPASLSTTPCSYPNFSPFRALTHLPRHETNSFEFVECFLNFYSPVGP
jgi:hypothetical protein